MYEILHEYTAGELLDWLKDTVVDDYVETIIEEDEDESYPLTVLNVDDIARDFIREIKRYEIFKRGHILYLHDNKTCQDLFSWRFDDSNYEEVQNTADAMCESLNNRSMQFIARKDRCW